MIESGRPASTESLQAAAGRAVEERYELVLYIAGTTPLSALALANVVAVCGELLEDRHDLRVIDVYQEPARAKADQIVAVPTLLKKAPLPVKRLIGDLSDRAQVLAGLGLRPDVRHETK